MHCIRCSHLTFHSDVIEVERVSPTEVLLHKIRIYECGRCAAMIKIILPALKFTHLIARNSHRNHRAQSNRWFPTRRGALRPTKECPCCGEVKKQSGHHIFPRRFYGRGHKNNHLFLLCEECHRELETYIPQYQKMPHAFYQAILDVFIEKLCKKAKLNSRHWKETAILYFMLY